MASLPMVASGGADNISLFVLSAISSPKQESGTYAPSKAAECLSTSRWSSGSNQLTYLEMTPYGGSACANAVYTYIRDATASGDIPTDCTVKIQGYDGSSWVDIETLSYLSTEIKAPVIKKFSNTTSYSKYRFNFQSYPYHNLSNNKFCGMMFIALLSV